MDDRCTFFLRQQEQLAAAGTSSRGAMSRRLQTIRRLRPDTIRRRDRCNSRRLSSARLRRAQALCSRTQVEQAKAQSAVAGRGAERCRSSAERCRRRSTRVGLRQTGGNQFEPDGRFACRLTAWLSRATWNVGQTVAASLSSPTLFTIANDLADAGHRHILGRHRFGRAGQGRQLYG